jgi:hypothetical protein
VKLAGEVAFVVVETPGAPSWPVFAFGTASDAQVAALRAALALPEVRSRCALVLTHHAPRLASGRPDWPWHGLYGADALLRAAAEGGAQAVLCGHVHDRFDLPATTGQARVICAGSSTQRGREGYWELEVQNARLIRATRRSIGGAPA